MTQMCPTKVCKDCGETKDLSAFSLHSKMKDGHINSCKACRKIYSKEHRKLNSTYYKEYEDYRTALPHRKELATRVRIAYREKYKLRYKANNLLNKAISKQEIQKQPCFICGSVKVVGHHTDYQEPLSVVWLCQKHHKELHSACSC